MDIFLHLFYLLLQITLFFLLLYLCKRFFIRFAVIEESHLLSSRAFTASGLSLAGYLGGIVILSSLAFSGESFGLFNDLLQITATVLLGTLLLMLNRIFVNGLMLGGYAKEIDIPKAHADDNHAVGLFQGIGFMAAAVQFYLSNSQFELLSLGTFMLSVPLFILGQLLMVFIHRLFVYKTAYDDLAQLSSGNIAVSISHGGLLIALSLLIGHAIGHTQSLDGMDVMAMLSYAAVGALFLIYLPFWLSRLFLGKWLQNQSIESHIEQDDRTVALVYASMRIAISVIVIHALPYGELL